MAAGGGSAGRPVRISARAAAVIWANGDPGRRMKAILFPSPDQVGLESLSTEGVK